MSTEDSTIAIPIFLRCIMTLILGRENTLPNPPVRGFPIRATKDIKMGSMTPRVTEGVSARK
jgi:hypothetical protein